MNVQQETPTSALSLKIVSILSAAMNVVVPTVLWPVLTRPVLMLMSARRIRARTVKNV